MYAVRFFHQLISLEQFGHSVNLLIAHSQTVEFTAWKTQLLVDKDIWKEKSLIKQ